MSGSSSVSLQARLRAAAPRLGPFAGRVHHRPRVGSTNDVAAELAGRGAPHGTVVVADEQTAGRGRHGNRWSSPPGAGLYLSVLLRTDSPPVLTLAAGVAVAEALAQAAGLDAALEWPNDVVARAVGRLPGLRDGPHPGGREGRRRRKVAGILAEASTVGHRVDRVVLGIGINLRDGEWPPEVASRAGSVEGLTGRRVDPAALLVEVLAALAARCAELEAGRVGALLRRWEALAPSSRGASVEWSEGPVRRRGVTEGVDEQGALIVRVAGRRERLSGGEVRHVG